MSSLLNSSAPAIPAVTDDYVRSKVSGSLAAILVALNDNNSPFGQQLCAYIVQALIEAPELMAEMTNAANSCALTNIVVSSNAGQASAHGDSQGSNDAVPGGLIEIGPDALSQIIANGFGGIQYGLIALLAHETLHCVNRASGDATVSNVIAGNAIGSAVNTFVSKSPGDVTAALNSYVNVRINDEVSAYFLGWNMDIDLRNTEGQQALYGPGKFFYSDEMIQPDINRALQQLNFGYGDLSRLPAPKLNSDGTVSGAVGSANWNAESTIVRYDAPSGSSFNYEENDYFDGIRIAWDSIPSSSQKNAQIILDLSKLTLTANTIGDFSSLLSNISFIGNLGRYLAGKHWSTDHPVAIYDPSANVTYVFSEPGAVFQPGFPITNGNSVLVTEYTGSVDLRDLPSSFVMARVYDQSSSDSANFQQVTNASGVQIIKCSISSGASVGQAASGLNLTVDMNPPFNGSSTNDPFQVVSGASLQRAPAPDTELAIVLSDVDSSDTVLVDTNSGSMSVSGTILGTGLAASGTNAWTANGVTYRFTSESSQDTNIGTMAITGGAVGDGDSIIIDDFDLGVAKTDPNGFLGIEIPSQLAITAGGPVSGSSGSPAPSLATVKSGQLQTFSVSLAAPADVAETLSISLSGGGSYGFSLDTGDGSPLIPVEGTVNVTIAAGQQSATFALIDTSDITQASQVILTASVEDSNGNVTSTSNLAFNFEPTTPDPFVDPDTTSTISGYYQIGDGGVITYTAYAGDGKNDAITAIPGDVQNGVDLSSGNDVVNDEQNGDVIGGFSQWGSPFHAGQSTPPTVESDAPESRGNNVINLHNHDDAVMAGEGDSRIYGNTEITTATAIQLANAGGMSSLQGALLTAGEGDNTIVGSTGNDLIVVGAGDNMIVAGPGNETILGGVDVISAVANWSASISSGVLDLQNFSYVMDPYTPPAGVTYEGNSQTGADVPYGTGNDTIFGGSGNSLIELSNGDNYVDCGSGDSTVFGGMGDNTIFGGSGDVYVYGGGGDDFIDGGSGDDRLTGNGGNNTIVGGTGNDVICAGSQGDQWATAETGSNLVESGSGNDVIFGTALFRVVDNPLDVA